MSDSISKVSSLLRNDANFNVIAERFSTVGYISKEEFEANVNESYFGSMVEQMFKMHKTLSMTQISLFISEEITS